MRGGRQTSAITRNHLLADVRQQLRYFGRYCRAFHVSVKVLIALGFFAQSFPSIIGAMEKRLSNTLFSFKITKVRPI
jgi:hypothetical protein